MSSGLSWFKFWCDAHGHPKIGSLSDGSFRLLTYVWALARRSSVPGKVFITPTKGIPARALAVGAGCSRPEEAEQMLASLVEVRLIHVASDGVISVHDFEENNRVPPSKTKDGRRKQKAKERARLPDVATVSPPMSPGDGEEKRQREVEVEVEEDKESKKETTDRPGPLPPLSAGRQTGPLVEWERLYRAQTGYTGDLLVAAGGADVVRAVRRDFEAEVARLSPLKAAAVCADMALAQHAKENRYPRHLNYFLKRLREIDGPYVDPIDADEAFWARKAAPGEH